MSRELILTAFYESQLILRADEGDGRTLVGVLVPWHTAATVDSSGRFAVAGGAAFEAFAPGSLDKTLSEAKKGIPLFGGKHPKTSAHEKPAGVLVRSENTPDGQIAEWRLFDNYEGREAREMAEAKIWTGFSLGAWPIRTDDSGAVAGRKLFLRQEVKLDHVAFLRNPAYADAELLALRAELEAADPGAAVRARARMRRLENRLK